MEKIISLKNKTWHRIILICLAVVILLVVIATTSEESSQPTSSYEDSAQNSTISSNTGSTYVSQNALTKEEADALRGTGYNNTRPNSSAENAELRAAQVKCKTCGRHSDNGYNSQCDSCRAKYGGS